MALSNLTLAESAASNAATASAEEGKRESNLDIASEIKTSSDKKPRKLLEAQNANVQVNVISETNLKNVY
jgi:hypothetical protein